MKAKAFTLKVWVILDKPYTTMKYTEFIESAPQEIISILRSNKRNSKINELLDYYDGRQWQVGSGGYIDQTRVTRSGKEMWKPFDDKNRGRGFTRGELKVWNIISAAIDIYSRYARGDERDDTTIVIYDSNDNADDKLSQEANALFPDLNDFVLRSTVRMCVTSVLVSKYDALLDDQDRLVFDKLNSDNISKARVEDLDAREIEPLYWKGEVRGFIRFYEITADAADALMQENGKRYDRRRRINPLYCEFWFVDDNGKVKLQKHIEGVKQPVEDADAPYDFLPIALQVNRAHPFKKFNLENIEGSEAADLIDIQDDLNSFLTDLNQIYTKVAIPLLKATDEFIKNASDKDIEKLKHMFSKISTMAGQILLAPVEKVGGGAPEATHVGHLNNIFEQYGRVTGIPKSVFNSEGLANIAAETLDNLMRSLRVRVGEKRTKIKDLIKDIVKMHFTQNAKWQAGMYVDVEFADMFGDSKAAVLDMILQSYREKVLPKLYVMERVIRLLGDGENIEKIRAQLVETDSEFKQELESILAENEIREEQVIAQLAAQNRDNAELNAA